LRAHYDGQKILLDEPFDLEAGAQLIVTVLPDHEDDERAAWLAFSLENLARAYGDDEPEYPLELIKERNPDFEGS
jgi:hypothetical protein